MVREHIEGVEFFSINTDTQALKRIESGKTIQIGNNITKGWGADVNLEVEKNLLKKIKTH